MAYLCRFTTPSLPFYNSSDFQYAVGLGVNCCSTGSEDSGSGAATSSNSYHNQSNSEISSATSIHLNQASSHNCHLPLATILHPSTLKLSLAQDALYDQYIPSVRIFHLHYLHKVTVAIPQKFYLSQFYGMTELLGITMLLPETYHLRRNSSSFNGIQSANFSPARKRVFLLEDGSESRYIHKPGEIVWSGAGLSLWVTWNNEKATTQSIIR